MCVSGRDAPYPPSLEKLRSPGCVLAPSRSSRSAWRALGVGEVEGNREGEGGVDTLPATPSTSPAWTSASVTAPVLSVSGCGAGLTALENSAGEGAGAAGGKRGAGRTEGIAATAGCVEPAPVRLAALLGSVVVCRWELFAACAALMCSPQLIRPSAALLKRPTEAVLLTGTPVRDSTARVPATGAPCICFSPSATSCASGFSPCPASCCWCGGCRCPAPAPEPGAVALTSLPSLPTGLGSAEEGAGEAGWSREVALPSVMPVEPLARGAGTRAEPAGRETGPASCGAPLASPPLPAVPWTALGFYLCPLLVCFLHRSALYEIHQCVKVVRRREKGRLCCTRCSPRCRGRDWSRGLRGPR